MVVCSRNMAILVTISELDLVLQSKLRDKNDFFVIKMGFIDVGSVIMSDWTNAAIQRHF